MCPVRSSGSSSRGGARRAGRAETHGGRSSLRARAREVRLDRRVRGRQSSAEGGSREPPRRTPRRAGARYPPALRSSRRPDPRPHPGSTATALASTRHVARARDPKRSARHREMARDDLTSPGAHRADHRVRVARELVREIAARTTRINELQRDLARLVTDYAPQLLAEPGCGPPTAAKLVGEIAGADRFATDAKLARTSGTAPIPAPRALPTATASIAAATASSTARCTASPSTKANGTPQPPPTSNANKPKASHAKKHSAASNATSPAASGSSSTPRQQPLPHDPGPPSRRSPRTASRSSAPRAA